MLNNLHQSKIQIDFISPISLSLCFDSSPANEADPDAPQ